MMISVEQEKLLNESYKEIFLKYSETELKGFFQEKIRENVYSSQFYVAYGIYLENRKSYRQAFLTYAQACFLCKETSVVKAELRQYFESFMQRNPLFCQKIAIIILTYNARNYTELCFQSIHNFCAPDTFSLYVIDNHSTDTTPEWLKKQRGITLQLNQENRGFAGGCNQGALLAKEAFQYPEKADYFFLNNDTIMMHNSLYNLAMALYEEEKTGAAGAICNSDFDEQSDNLEDYFAYCMQNNYYEPAIHQKTQKLTGFALMVKAHVYYEVGGFDESFGIGNYEDDDLCLKISMKGYDLRFCQDAFIYHYGHKSFEELKNIEQIEFQDLLTANRTVFEKKWGFSSKDFASDVEELTYLLPENASGNLLQIDCKTGATLQLLQNKFENLSLWGLDENEQAILVAAKQFHAFVGTVENSGFTFPKQKFEYVILSRDFACYDNDGLFKHLKNLLAKDGQLLFYFKNKEAGQFMQLVEQGANGFYSVEEIVEKFEKQSFQVIELRGETGDVTRDSYFLCRARDM